MDLTGFLFYALPLLTAEVMAASIGTYFLKRKQLPFKNTEYFILFLWITVFVEVVGLYAPIAYFSNYEYFSFLLDTRFVNNYWWYNLYNVLSFSFYILYFNAFLKNRYLKSITHIAVGLFVLFSILVFIFSQNFFNGYSPYIVIVGTLMLFFSIVLFYFELLRSDLLLQLKRFLPFYVSVGILVFTLCITPIEIFIQYFNLEGGNKLFVTLRSNVLFYGNVFMYSVFTLGFLICSVKKKLF